MERDHSHRRERGDTVQSVEWSAMCHELRHSARVLRWHRPNTLDNSGRMQVAEATALLGRNERRQSECAGVSLEHLLDSIEYLEQLVGECREGRRVDVRGCFDHDIDWG